MKNIIDKIKNSTSKRWKIYGIANVIVEFILSIILAIAIYEISYVKATIGVISRKYLIIAIGTAIPILGIIILNFIRYKEKTEKIFLSFLIPLGLLYLVLVIPYYVPDEAPHIIRAYETYQGEFISSLNEEGKHRAVIPKDFKDLKLTNLHDYITLKEQISKKTDYSNCEEAYTEAQSYPGILYLISGLGLAIGRIFKINIIFAMYLGRMFNFIFFLVLAYYAIKKIPFGKLLLSTYLLMPMVLQQAASVSPDSVINSITIFFISYVIYIVYRNEDLKKIEIAMVIAMSAFIAVAKVVYLPLVFLLLLLIQNKAISKNKKIFVIVTSTVIAVILGGFWYMYQGRYQDERDYVQERNINATEQIKGILTNPVGYLAVLGNTLDKMGLTYLYGMIGDSLGWQNIQVAPYMILLYLIILICSIWFEKHEKTFNKKQKIFSLIIALGTIILIFTALYAGWTDVGAGIIVGVQGRYFIPVAILILLSMCLKNNYVKIKNIEVIYFVLISLINLSAILSIQQFFIV